MSADECPACLAIACGCDRIVVQSAERLRAENELCSERLRDLIGKSRLQGDEIAKLRAENELLRRVADAARLFLSLPYDNGQHEQRLKDELAALPVRGEDKP